MLGIQGLITLATAPRGARDAAGRPRATVILPGKECTGKAHSRADGSRARGVGARNRRSLGARRPKWIIIDVGNGMTQPTQLDRVCAAVRAAAEEGCPVAGNAEAKARVAIRRWGSYNNRGVSEDDLNERTRDLAKGLAHHFEQEPSLVGPLMIDYEYLASRIVDVLTAH